MGKILLSCSRGVLNMSLHGAQSILEDFFCVDLELSNPSLIQEYFIRVNGIQFNDGDQISFGAVPFTATFQVHLVASASADCGSSTTYHIKFRQNGSCTQQVSLEACGTIFIQNPYISGNFDVCGLNQANRTL